MGTWWFLNDLLKGGCEEIKGEGVEESEVRGMDVSGGEVNVKWSSKRGEEREVSVRQGLSNSTEGWEEESAMGKVVLAGK